MQTAVEPSGRGMRRAAGSPGGSAPVLAPFHRASRLAGLGVTEMLRIAQRAAALRAGGADVIELCDGEPEPEVPEILRAPEPARAVPDSLGALKLAICRRVARDTGLGVEPARVSVGAGARQVIFNAFMATLEPGDEVVIPAPGRATYAAITRICGGLPVMVPCDPAEGFRLSAARLAEAITPRTRWLMLNSPSTPAGAVYGAAHYAPLIEVLRRAQHVWLLSDESYGHLVYDGAALSPLQLAPDLADRCLVVNGVSQGAANAGWRLGYGAGPEKLTSAMRVVLGQSSSGASPVSQAAAIAALDGPQAALEAQRDAFRARRDLVATRIGAIRGLSPHLPEGGRYAFPGCAGVIGARTPEGTVIDSDRDFCRWILERAHVALAPGAAFGCSPFLRLSLAAPETRLGDAMDRLERACGELALG